MSRFSIRLYCTREIFFKWTKFISNEPSYCFPNKKIQIGYSKLSYVFNLLDFITEKGASFWEYYFHFVVLIKHIDTLITSVRLVIYDEIKEKKIICLKNCENPIDFNRQIVLLAINVGKPGNFDHVWGVRGELTKYKTGANSTFEINPFQIENMTPGTYYIDLNYTDLDSRETSKSSFNFSMNYTSTQFCHIYPETGFSFETEFTLNCFIKDFILIHTSFCHSHKKEALIRYFGQWEGRLTGLTFAKGSESSNFKRCLFITIKNETQKVPFKVYPGKYYIPFFQYLGKTRHNMLFTLRNLGNAVNFLNLDASKEDLEIKLKTKYRSILLDFLVNQWNNAFLALEKHEIIRIIYRLSILPDEINPFHFIKSLDFEEILKFYGHPFIEDYNFVDVVEGGNLLFNLLNNLMVAGYSHNGTADDIHLLVKTVSNAIHVIANRILRNKDTSWKDTRDFNVFLLFMEKIDLESLNLTEALVIGNRKEAEVTINENILQNALNAGNKFVHAKVIVFPFNPLGLEKHTMFTPTASVSLMTESNKDLILDNFTMPVELKIPTLLKGEWLEMAQIKTITNFTVSIPLPIVDFDNTLNKFGVFIKFQDDIRMEIIQGIIIFAVCKGSPKKYKNTLGEIYEGCFELFISPITFYKSISEVYNFTLPLMFTTENSSLVFLFRSLINCSLTLTISIIQLSCQYWSKNYERNYGCLVVPDDDLHETTVCICYHLSVFGSMIEYYNFSLGVEITEYFANETLSSFYTMVVVWIFFTFLGIHAKIKDIRLAPLKLPVDLSDNFPSAQVVYMAVVETGMRPFAGCNGTVFIMLNGSTSKSLAHRMKSKSFKTLQTGHQNYFIIRTKESLGKIVSVRMWISDDGEEKKISWYCDKVTIFDLQTRDAYTFLCDEWLGLNIKGMLSDLTFFAASDLVLNDFRHLFTVNFFRGFEDSHAWFSIFLCPIISPYTRIQRVGSCLLNCLFYLLTTLLLQQNDDRSNANSNVFYTGVMEVAMTLVFGFMSMPVFWFFTFMFSECRSRETTYNISVDWKKMTSRQLSRKKQEKAMEEEIGMTFLGFLYHIRVLISKKFSKNKNKYEFQQLPDIEEVNENYFKKHRNMFLHMKKFKKLGDPYTMFEKHDKNEYRVKRTKSYFDKEEEWEKIQDKYDDHISVNIEVDKEEKAEDRFNFLQDNMKSKSKEIKKKDKQWDKSKSSLVSKKRFRFAKFFRKKHSLDRIDDHEEDKDPFRFDKDFSRDDKRLSRLENKLSKIDKKHSKLDRKLSRTEESYSKIGKIMSGLDPDLGDLNEKLNGRASKINQTKSKIDRNLKHSKLEFKKVSKLDKKGSKIDKTFSKLARKNSKVQRNVSKIGTKKSKDSKVSKSYKNSKEIHKSSKTIQIKSKEDKKKLNIGQKYSKLGQKHSKLDQKHSKLDQKHSKLDQKHSKLGQRQNLKADQSNSKLGQRIISKLPSKNSKDGQKISKNLSQNIKNTLKNKNDSLPRTMSYNRDKQQKKKTN